MKQSAVSFKAKGLTFEGVVAQPDGDSMSIPGVVLCHPHPLFGGSMDNNVILSLAFALAEEGFATLRFNFRGVGNSEGDHSKGELEGQEAAAALELMKSWPSVDGRRLGLAGYSFGASVILRNPSLHHKARAFALVSPPLRALESTPMKKSKRPALVICGDRDKLVQSDQLPALLNDFEHPPACEILAGADHYWFGQESRLAPLVGQFLAEHLK